MSPETLNRVLSGGCSEGKKDGHGIGLSVVQESVKEYDGKIWAESEVGKGTKFFVELLLLNKSQATSAKIKLHTQEKVLIVDDDPLLQMQWKSVFADYGIETLIFSSYEELVQHEEELHNIQTAIVDYNFEGSKKCGEDVLRYLQQKNLNHLYLCTGDYWKPSIQKLAQDLNVELLSKPLPHLEIEIKKIELKKNQAPKNEVNISKHSHFHVLVIDDDDGIRLAWKVSKQRLGIHHLDTFASMEECEAANINYTEYHHAYVDKNIEGSTWPLAKTLCHLKERGVAKVIIASGEDPREIEQDPAFIHADAICAPDKIPAEI